MGEPLKKHLLDRLYEKFKKIICIGEDIVSLKELLEKNKTIYNSQQLYKIF